MLKKILHGIGVFISLLLLLFAMHFATIYILLKKVKKIAGIRSGLPAHAISAMLFLPANVSYFSLF